MNLIETGYHQVNADRDPNLGSNGVLAGAEERFYAQVLLDPLEEQFDLPSALVDRCDDICGQIEVVRQKDQPLPGLGIEEADTSELFRVVSLTFVSAQSNSLVATQTAGLVDGTRLSDIKSRIAFRSNDKISVRAFNLEESGKVKVSAVKNVDATSLNKHPIHEVDVMHRTVCNLYKNWDRASQVDLSVKFDCSFGFTEMSPWKHGKAQVDCGSIDGINHLVDAQPVGVSAVKTSGLTDQNLSECFINSPVSVLVGIGQISPRDIAPDAHGVKMRASSQTSLDVAKALPESDLSKSHCQKLISGSHTFACTRHRVTINAASQLLRIQNIHDLGEYESSDVHPLLRMKPLQDGQPVQMQDTALSLLAA